MPLPVELQGDITVNSSFQTVLGYRPSARVQVPEEDTVRIMKGGPYAYHIYDDLLRDARVFGAFRKRIKETTTQPFVVEPASDDRRDTQAAEIVQAQLRRFYNQYTKKKLSAIIKGLSVGEIMWREPTSRREADRLGATAIVKQVDFRRPWHFRFAFNEEDEKNHLHYVGQWGYLFYGAPNGQDLDAKHPRKFLSYTWGTEYNDPYGKGLGHQLYWPVFFKRNDLTLWLYYADKYGMPTIDVAYDADKLNPSNERDKAAIQSAEDAADKVKTKGVIVHSNAFIYKLLEAQRRGDVSTYDDLIDYCDREIVIAILGSTLAVDLQGQGSRAAAETHQGDIAQLAKDDAESAAEHDMETLVKWITELNVPDAEPPRVYRAFPNTTDYEGMSKTHLNVVEAVDKGLDADYAERTYGIQLDRSRLAAGNSNEKASGADAGVDGSVDGRANSKTGLLRRFGKWL